MKQINILLPCVDDSQRSYTSEVQLQYDEPLYNQVVGRLIMDGVYAPINSKIYRNNCEITRPRYSKHILPVPLLYQVPSLYQGSNVLLSLSLSISSDLPNLIINEQWHILYILWVFTLSLCCLRKKILHYPTQGFGEKQFPQMQGIDGKLDWNKTTLSATACSACSNRSCSSH